MATGEPLDKAGAYAAQGEGRRFIEAIEGSESNVIGLPLEETLALLARRGRARCAASPRTPRRWPAAGERALDAAAAARGPRPGDGAAGRRSEAPAGRPGVAAAVRAGLRDIGENYVQEAAAKRPEDR